MKENCRTCHVEFDSNDLSSGGVFGTCSRCLKDKQAARIRASAPSAPPSRSMLPPLDAFNALSLQLDAAIEDFRKSTQNFVEETLPHLTKSFDTLSKLFQEGWEPGPEVFAEINPLSRKEDFYLPTREDVEKPYATQGTPDLAADMEYVRDKLCAALRIPEEYLRTPEPVYGCGLQQLKPLTEDQVDGAALAALEMAIGDKLDTSVEEFQKGIFDALRIPEERRAAIVKRFDAKHGI